MVHGCKGFAIYLYLNTILSCIKADFYFSLDTFASVLVLIYATNQVATDITMDTKVGTKIQAT